MTSNILNKYLFITLPMFIFLSGNFTPLRVGPITPVYFWIITFLFNNIASARFFIFHKKYILLLITFLILIFVQYFLIFSYELNKFNTFLGSIRTDAYFFMSLIRYFLIMNFILILMTQYEKYFELIKKAIFITFYVLSITLLIQFSLDIIGIKVGYVFPGNFINRYGSFIGEPQTAQAWISLSAFYLLYNSQITGRLYLIIFLTLSLILTSSSAWIAATIIYFAIENKIKFKNIVQIIMGTIFLVYLIGDKFFAEFFVVSERSITILAGIDIYSKYFFNIIFGYGVGLSPYVIGESFWFNLYPSMWLGDNFGRQNVMNTPIEYILEFGIYGFILVYAYVSMLKEIGIKINYVLSLPLILGLMTIGGGFVSAYFAIFFPLLIIEPNRQKKITTY